LASGLSVNFIGVSPIRALVFAAVFNAAPHPYPAARIPGDLTT
jgi:hypothetical protein